MFSNAAPQTSHALDHLAREVTTSGVAPTVACCAAYRAAGRWRYDKGRCTVAPRLPAESEGAWVFDLASVTKPFVAVAIHVASSEGTLDVNARVRNLLPELVGTASANTPLSWLVAHRAGLLPHIELFEVMRARRAPTPLSLLRRAANTLGSKPVDPGTHASPVYSDLGYILAGAAIARQTAMPLADWFARERNRLGWRDVGTARQWQSSVDSGKATFVPTEVVPWRGGLLKGVVHDENAWLLSGHDLSGHAGLFGTAEGVAKLGTAVLDALAGRSGPIAQRAARSATARWPDGLLCSGFDRVSDAGSSAGEVCSRESFGHLGFTGTSIWCDPVAQTVAVLLTNRVCPSRENLRIRLCRPQIHDALFRWARAQSDEFSPITRPA